MKPISICPQTIYKFNLGKMSLQGVLQKICELEYRPNVSNLASVNSQVLDLPALGRLKSSIQECIDAVNQTVYGLAGIRITQSWASRMTSGMQHHLHVHPNSFVSGVVFLTDSKANICFSVDDMWHSCLPGIQLEEQRPAITFKERTIAGKLLIFPSTLRHCVEKNEDSQERLTISFNTFIQGTVGWGLSRLTL